MRLDLPSTLIRWAFSPRENASIWKRSWKWIKIETHTYRISVDRRKGIKMKTMTENIERICSIRLGFNLSHNVQFYLFERADSQKRTKTVVWTRIDRRVFYDMKLWKRTSAVQGLAAEYKH